MLRCLVLLWFFCFVVCNKNTNTPHHVVGFFLLFFSHYPSKAAGREIEKKTKKTNFARAHPRACTEYTSKGGSLLLGPHPPPRTWGVQSPKGTNLADNQAISGSRLNWRSGHNVIPEGGLLKTTQNTSIKPSRHNLWRNRGEGKNLAASGQGGGGGNTIKISLFCCPRGPRTSAKMLSGFQAHKARCCASIPLGPMFGGFVG